ncbi:MAG: transporter substrate-binding domain-containing protein [Dinoroseobacter sp.]|nr:transporter substrate-binding domain-containing protein [Dinoroseobacter sp.]
MTQTVIRAAINTGNRALVQQSDDGRLGGVSPALAAAWAEAQGATLEPVVYRGARKVFDDAGSGAWDIAFLAIDPARAGRVSFSVPYVQIEASYAVRADSPFQAVQEADAPGVQILTGRGSAYDLYLNGILKNARILHGDTPGESFEKFKAGEGDLVAGVRQSLERVFGADPAYRILPGRFGTIDQAMALPAPDHPLLPALNSFVAQAIGTGLVARALADSGQGHLRIPHSSGHS